MNPPTAFEKMRANRCRQPQGGSRADRLLSQIDALEREMVEEWRAAGAFSAPGASVKREPNWRLFGWKR